LIIHFEREGTMLTGLKGVKYGLQPGAKSKAKPALQKPLNVFGVDDDSGDEAPTVGRDIARQAAKKQADKKVPMSLNCNLCHARTKSEHSFFDEQMRSCEPVFRAH
jgi:hypothetical protein